jgi:hypothetical protein
LMPKMAIWNLSPGLRAVLSTTRACCGLRWRRGADSPSGDQTTLQCRNWSRPEAVGLPPCMPSSRRSR